MQQKLTTFVLLSTVLGIGTGASATASSSPLTEQLALLDHSSSTQVVSPLVPISATESSLPSSDISLTDQPELVQAEAIPLPPITQPEEIGGLGGPEVLVSQQVPATPPPADSFPEPLPEPEPGSQSLCDVTSW